MVLYFDPTPETIPNTNGSSMVHKRIFWMMSCLEMLLVLPSQMVVITQIDVGMLVMEIHLICLEPVILNVQPVETGSITVAWIHHPNLPNGTYTNLVANGNANWNG